MAVPWHGKFLLMRSCQPLVFCSLFSNGPMWVSGWRGPFRLASSWSPSEAPVVTSYFIITSVIAWTCLYQQGRRPCSPLTQVAQSKIILYPEDLILAEREGGKCLLSPSKQRDGSELSTWVWLGPCTLSLCLCSTFQVTLGHIWTDESWSGNGVMTKT